MVLPCQEDTHRLNLTFILFVGAAGLAVPGAAVERRQCVTTRISAELRDESKFRYTTPLYRSGPVALALSTSTLLVSALIAGLLLASAFLVTLQLSSRSVVPPLAAAHVYALSLVFIFVSGLHLFGASTLSGIVYVRLRPRRSSVSAAIRMSVLVLIGNLLGAIAAGYVFGIVLPVEAGPNHPPSELHRIPTVQAFWQGIPVGWLLAYATWLSAIHRKAAGAFAVSVTAVLLMVSGWLHPVSAGALLPLEPSPGSAPGVTWPVLTAVTCGTLVGGLAAVGMFPAERRSADSV